MKLRIDLTDIHGYFEGEFVPDEDTIVWNESTTEYDIVKAFREYLDIKEELTDLL